MKIVSLSASNIKRLHAVEITPDGAVVVVTGKNGAGKSSVLDSIEYALAGKSSQCPQPVRRGAKRAEVVCDLGEMKVRRTFTPDGGGSLIVEANGERQMSPQTILDALVGKLTFDPLAFSRMAARDQAETLRALVGLDTSSLDAERARAFNDRTNVNRDLKSAEARLTTAPGPHPDAPKEELAPGAILAEMDAAQNTNDANATARRLSERAAEIAASILDEAAGIREQIKQLNDNLAEAEKAHAAAAERAGKLAKAAEDLEDVDVAPFRERLASLGTVNRQVRDNAARADLARDVKRLAAESRKMTQTIDDADERRESMLREARFPVEGMGFGEDGSVTLGGLPFEQASHAEQLRVSVAMGLAANPALRVLLIRDGSLLDGDGMKLVAAMAEQADAQLWIERVEGDQPGAVVIEDGSVAGAPAGGGDA